MFATLRRLTSAKKKRVHVFWRACNALLQGSQSEKVNNETKLANFQKNLENLSVLEKLKMSSDRACPETNKKQVFGEKMDT